MYFITTKRMLEVCFSAHPNIQYRTLKNPAKNRYSCSLLGFIRSNIVFAISYKVKQLFICIYLVCALSFVF